VRKYNLFSNSKQYISHKKLNGMIIHQTPNELFLKSLIFELISNMEKGISFELRRQVSY
jgi:hypothetical protein